LLLEHGSLAVWVIYPRSEKVRVHLQGAESLHGLADSLTFELLPGWELPVAKLFE